MGSIPSPAAGCGPSVQRVPAPAVPSDPVQRNPAARRGSKQPLQKINDGITHRRAHHWIPPPCTGTQPCNGRITASARGSSIVLGNPPPRPIAGSSLPHIHTERDPDPPGRDPVPAAGCSPFRWGPSPRHASSPRPTEWDPLPNVGPSLVPGRGGSGCAHGDRGPLVHSGTCPPQSPAMGSNPHPPRTERDRALCSADVGTHCGPAPPRSPPPITGPSPPLAAVPIRPVSPSSPCSASHSPQRDSPPPLRSPAGGSAAGPGAGQRGRAPLPAPPPRSPHVPGAAGPIALSASSRVRAARGGGAGGAMAASAPPPPPPPHRTGPRPPRLRPPPPRLRSAAPSAPSRSGGAGPGRAGGGGRRLRPREGQRRTGSPRHRDAPSAGSPGTASPALGSPPSPRGPGPLSAALLGRGVPWGPPSGP